MDIKLTSELFSNLMRRYFKLLANYVPEIPKYEESYYCNENKIIHHNEKEYLNCKHCN